MAAPRNEIKICFLGDNSCWEIVSKIEKLLDIMQLREDFAEFYGLPVYFEGFNKTNIPEEADIILEFERIDYIEIDSKRRQDKIQKRQSIQPTISRKLSIEITRDKNGISELESTLSIVKQPSIVKNGQMLSFKKVIVMRELFDMIMSMIEFKLNVMLALELENSEGQNANFQNIPNSPIFYMPIVLLEMPWVEYLNISNKNIGRIQFLETLTNLKYLNLSHNQIEKIENLDNNKNIVELNLLQNKITKIENLNHLDKLQNLYLAFNQIESADGLTSFKHLDQFTINNNPLEQIDALGNLENIRLLTLSNTPIKSIKPIQHLIKNGSIIETGKPNIQPNNAYIFLDGCFQLEDPNFEIVNQGNEAVLNYWKATEVTATQKFNFLKIILLGNSRVGKTDFSHFLRKGAIQDTSVSTHLLEISDWQPTFFNNENYENLSVKIFDFGGQDYYHDAYRLFFSSNTAYVVLWETATNAYNITDELFKGQTSLSYENYPINYWLETINDFVKRKQYNTVESKFESDTESISISMDTSAMDNKIFVNQTPILLLQNKIDIDKSLLDQSVLKEKYGLITQFFDVSLKNKKRTGILNEVLTEFIDSMNLTTKNLFSYQAALVEFWKQKSEEAFQVFTIETFLEVCQASGIALPKDFGVEQSKIIADILNAAGYLLYDEALGLVFTNLPALNSTFKSVLELAMQAHCKGIINSSQIEEQGIDSKVVLLLEKFKLLIKLNDKQYLNAQFLPLKPHPNIQFFLDSFLHNHVQYEYPAFFSNSILTQLFVQFLQEALLLEELVVEHLPIWKYGIVIKQKNERMQDWVYVELKKETSKGIIKIWTVQPFDRNKLEGKVMQAIESIHQGWTVNKKVSIDNHSYLNAEELMTNALASKFITYVDNKPTPISKFKNVLDLTKTAIPKKMFISYCSANSKHMHQLSKNLKVLQEAHLIDFWYDRMIQPGTNWDESIQKELQEADVILFMVSSDFLLSKYIMEKEVPNAIELTRNGNKRLEIILVEDCLFEETIIGAIQLKTNDGEKKEIFVITDPLDQGKWKNYLGHLKKVLTNK